MASRRPTPLRFVLNYALPSFRPSAAPTKAPTPLRIVLNYAVAVAVVAFTAVLKHGLNGFLERDSPFLLFFAAVMVAAWYGGLGPGLLATVLADMASNYFFMDDPPYSLRFTQDQGVRLGLFLVEGVCISVLAGVLQRARQRAEASAAVARELEHTLAEVSEAERRRLGRDLHDGLGQHLTGVALLSKALQQKLAAAGRTEASVAGEVAELVNESIDSIRDLARGLTPMDLDRTSLPSALRDLARGLTPMDLDRTSLPSALRELAARTERLCRVECQFDGDEALIVADDDTALNLYRVAQEAVNNAVKHANARHVWVTLSADAEGRAALRVRDDGVGLSRPPGEAAPVVSRGGGDGPSRPSGKGDGKGMGLRIMKYRANVVGARFELQSAPGKGTTVSCVLPAGFGGPTAVPADDADPVGHPALGGGPLGGGPLAPARPAGGAVQSSGR